MNINTTIKSLHWHYHGSNGLHQSPSGKNIKKGLKHDFLIMSEISLWSQRLKGRYSLTLLTDPPLSVLIREDLKFRPFSTVCSIASLRLEPVSAHKREAYGSFCIVLAHQTHSYAVLNQRSFDCRFNCNNNHFEYFASILPPFASCQKGYCCLQETTLPGSLVLAVNFSW